VYSSFQLAYKYLHYYLTASNGKGHGIHSPFVFEFITKVLNDKEIYPAYRRVEELREKLLHDDTVLAIEDFGAGSSVSKSNQRTIASIAKNAAKPKKFGQLLYRLVQYYKPGQVLELGTSLGVTASYLASGNSDANILTFEGSKAIAESATNNFQSLGLNNIELITGNFDETLSPTIKRFPSIDFAFIDGNHRYKPTINYFNQILTNTNNSSVLIFDDIHWSKEMEQAWEEIKTHSAVSCTIDLFFIGLVFFRSEIKEKQHFKIRF
jgi:predicted O-methyltransferase YrrM